MTDAVTASELREWLDANRKTAAWVGKMLGVAPSTPTRWLKGSDIPEPMDKLLRLLLRGEVPFGLLPERGQGVLEFTPAEWRVIELLRVREGFEDAHAWIAAKIRAYLAMSRAVGGAAPLKVAEEPPTYGEPGGEGRR